MVATTACKELHGRWTRGTRRLVRGWSLQPLQIGTAGTSTRQQRCGLQLGLLRLPAALTRARLAWLGPRPLTYTIGSCPRSSNQPPAVPSRLLLAAHRQWRVPAAPRLPPPSASRCWRGAPSTATAQMPRGRRGRRRRRRCRRCLLLLPPRQTSSRYGSACESRRPASASKRRRRGSEPTGSRRNDCSS